jgi:hypothetical protein
MTTDGISGLGDSAEVRFRRITGATRALRAKDGDAVLFESNIEIKRAGAKTLNQVRAVKYIPLVALYEKTDTWYVVPAPDVVRLVSSKTRGQHTENPFESATLSIQNLDAFSLSDERELKDAVRRAVHRGQAFPDLKRAMQKVLSDSKALATSSKDEIQVILSRLGL